MKSKKNIVLVGMMGSGKSSIGKKLSKKLNLNFIDIDKKIEDYEKLEIKEIFKKYGENYFRKVEEKISLQCLKFEDSLIALGGGGFLNLQIRKQCQVNCLSFWLNWQNEVIINRIYKNKKRPLVVEMNREQINNLIKARSKVYKLSDHKINCDKLDKVKIINKISEIYENKQN